MDSIKIKRLEFNSICRLCIQLFETEKVSPIFNNEVYAERVTLPERIRYCSSVEVYEGDGLPNNICSTCLLKLNQSFVFRNQCVLADNTLKKLLRDVTLNVSELPHFVNVDMENQLIQPENLPLESNACGCHLGTADSERRISQNGKEHLSIDEFDNSKNGRHKKNINRSNDRSIQRVKICTNGVSNFDSIGFQFLNESDGGMNSASASDEGLCERKSKRRKFKIRSTKKKNDGSSEEEFSENESRCKVKKGRKGRGKKLEEEEIEIKEEIKEEADEVQESIENFTVEPDVFDFGETKKEVVAGGERELTREEQHRHVNKANRERGGATKRGRPRKCSIVKEKPSSYTCEYCQKVYPSEGGWRYHIHTMHNENYQPFICDLCGKAFKVKKNLEGHKNSIHYHLKHHLCDLCGRGFASKYALKVHKIWHSDEKNFACDICGTKFRTRGKMNTHRSIHGGPKKFMCHVCSRDFRWKKDFEIHMRTHTGEKPFKCSHCGKAFSSLTNMKKHERNHVGKSRLGQVPDAFDEPGAESIVGDIMYKTELPFQYNCESKDAQNGEFS